MGVVEVVAGLLAHRSSDPTGPSFKWGESRAVQWLAAATLRRRVLAKQLRPCAL
jgi:hypothetical protein